MHHYAAFRAGCAVLARLLLQYHSSQVARVSDKQLFFSPFLADVMASILHLTRRVRYRIAFAALLLLSICVLWMLASEYSQPDGRRCFTENWATADENAAASSLYHAVRLEDVLLSDEKPTPGRSIFFHDTTCRDLASHTVMKRVLGSLNNRPRAPNMVELTGRQACAIESAALHNPNFNVFVLFARPSYMDNQSTAADGILEAILSYSNVRLRNLNMWTYAAGTPMYEWIKQGDLFNSNYLLSHASDFLRYLTLWRWGGIYMDMDTVTLRSLEEVPPNYTGAESDRSLAAGVMNFGHTGFGHEVATQCLHDFQRNFRGDDWGNNGPGVITRVLSQLCNTKRIPLMIDAVKRCSGFRVFDREIFYAVPWSQWEVFFDTKHSQATLERVRPSYVAHVWNNLSKGRPLNVQDSEAAAAYTQLAAKHCPRVYAAVGEYF